MTVGTFRAGNLENKMLKKIWFSIRDALIAPEFRCSYNDKQLKEYK
jgi:hypothetical protein